MLIYNYILIIPLQPWQVTLSLLEIHLAESSKEYVSSPYLVLNVHLLQIYTYVQLLYLNYVLSPPIS